MHAKRTSRFVPARVDSGGDDGSRENEEFRERERNVKFSPVGDSRWHWTRARSRLPSYIDAQGYYGEALRESCGGLGNLEQAAKVLFWMQQRMRLVFALVFIDFDDVQEPYSTASAPGFFIFSPLFLPSFAFTRSPFVSDRRANDGWLSAHRLLWSSSPSPLFLALSLSLSIPISHYLPAFLLLIYQPNRVISEPGEHCLAARKIRIFVSFPITSTESFPLRFQMHENQ